MASLMDSLNQTVTPEVIGKIGTKLGVDSATAQQATEIGVPLITSGIAKASSTPAGATSVLDMLGKLDPSMAGDALGAITGAPEAGNNILNSIFGSALGPITTQIKQASGIDVSSFLPILAPLVAGAIGKFAKGNNLDAAGLANVLQTETKSFADSGSPIAGLVSGAMNQIGSPVSSTSQAAGQAAAAAATAGSVAGQASSTVSSAANSAAATASSAARDVSSTVTSGGRPTGITILGVLAIIGGILSLCGGVGGLGLGAAFGLGGAVAPGILSSVAGLGSLAAGILYLVGGIGLLSLKNWARILLLIAVIIGLISAVMQIIGGLTGGGDLLGGLIGLVINGAILWYLQRPDVKAAFGK